MSDVAGYWARQLHKVPLASEAGPWKPDYSTIVPFFAVVPRQMTAGDLGLPLPQWAPEFLMSLYGRRADPRKPSLYHWLGKDAEAFA